MTSGTIVTETIFNVMKDRFREGRYAGDWKINLTHLDLIPLVQAEIKKESTN